MKAYKYFVEFEVLKTGKKIVNGYYTAANANLAVEYATNNCPELLAKRIKK